MLQLQHVLLMEWLQLRIIFVGETYDFNPTGPTVDASGVISNLTFGTSYVVTALMEVVHLLLLMRLLLVKCYQLLQHR